MCPYLIGPVQVNMGPKKEKHPTPPKEKKKLLYSRKAATCNWQMDSFFHLHIIEELLMRTPHHKLQNNGFKLKLKSWIVLSSTWYKATFLGPALRKRRPWQVFAFPQRPSRLGLGFPHYLPKRKEWICIVGHKEEPFEPELIDKHKQ